MTAELPPPAPQPAAPAPVVAEAEPLSQPEWAPQPKPVAAAAEPVVVQEAPPAPTPAPVVDADRGEHNVHELERLVRAHAEDFPDRAEEWEIYLDSIREYAGPDGQLPVTLDWLVWDTFGELLGRSAER